MLWEQIECAAGPTQAVYDYQLEEVTVMTVSLRGGGQLFFLAVYSSANTEMDDMSLSVSFWGLRLTPLSV